MPAAPDDEGAMPVLEAILVALLVLSAILFVTSVQRPRSGAEEGGIDLSKLAGETLSILRGNNITVGFESLNFTTWMGRAMDGDTAAAAAASEYLRKALPPGTRHTLSITNGYGAIRVVPEADPGLPRGGRAAEAPFLPEWAEFAAAATTETAWPGQPVPLPQFEAFGNFTPVAPAVSLVQCIEAPTGSSVGPGGVPWLDVWRERPGHVPLDALYGTWASYTDVDCTAEPKYARVTLRDGTATDHAVYGVRLVVWFGV